MKPKENRSPGKEERLKGGESLTAGPSHEATVSQLTVKQFEIHPLADVFPEMGEMELRELTQDIKANGQLEPIVIHQGKILDGRNRYLACKLAGVEPTTIEFNPVATCRTAEEYVWSMNVQRRHLRADQRREVIAKLLRADPTKSNRQIASQAKADNKTVGVVRREMEATEEIPQLPETVGADGKKRTAKPKRKVAATPKESGNSESGDEADRDVSFPFDEATVKPAEPEEGLNDQEIDEQIIAAAIAGRRSLAWESIKDRVEPLWEQILDVINSVDEEDRIDAQSALMEHVDKSFAGKSLRADSE
jgi:ParB-like chromosome segregation protein Spo0J